MIYKRTADAASEPVTRTEAKTHLKVDGTDDDTLIDRLISAARRVCEAYTDRSFITQTWVACSDSFPDAIELLHGPVISVTSITYLDTNGSSQTLATSGYTSDLNSLVARIKPVDSWPSTKEIMNAVTVTYTTGFGASASNVPEDIKAAMLLIIGKMYDTREDTVKRMPTHAEWLLDQYKIYHTI